MPKKKDGPDSKKARKTSSTSKDTSNTSPGAGEIVPPPNPIATHLVASNPFDDPPSNAMKVGPGGYPFPNQPMVRLQAPNGGMGPTYPGWNRPELRGMRPPYNAPGTPGWNVPMHANSAMNPHPMYPPGMGPSHTMPNNGYPMNRPHYVGPGLTPYRGSPRMVMGSMRPGMGPLGSPGSENMMMDPQSMGPNHDVGFTNMVSSGNQGHMLQNTGQMMKALTRPSPQQASPTAAPTRKASTSSSKATDRKSPKTGESSTKSRKKSEKKSNEAKAKSESEKVTPTSVPELSIISHSIPPELPQVCRNCSNDITADDVIRCLASCKKWYHRTCVGLTELAYKHLKSEELAVWACDNCLQTKEVFSVQSRAQFMDQLSSAA